MSADTSGACSALFVTRPSPLALPFALAALSLEARLDSRARYARALSGLCNGQRAANQLNESLLGSLAVLSLAARVTGDDAHRSVLAHARA
jgi:hypothetical protein